MPKDLTARAGFPESGHRPLLLESEPRRLARLHAGLREAGIDVLAVCHLADIEQWPSDTLVITDIDHFTLWWREVGATGVIVLADTQEQGVAACQRGATNWLPHNCTTQQLLAAINAQILCRTQA